MVPAHRPWPYIYAMGYPSHGRDDRYHLSQIAISTHRRGGIPRTPDAPRPTASETSAVRALRYTGAPLPPYPRALRVPLRRAASVLGVTACGMIVARLSREVTLVAVRLGRNDPGCGVLRKVAPHPTT